MAEQGLHRYEVLGEIGKGGTGTVYRGIDRQTGHAVAIKHLRGDLANSINVERFRLEGEILRRLNHPNIVQLLDTVEANGEHYLITELMEGGSLRELLDRSEPLEIRRVLALSIEIVDALTRAHHLRIIHRDIKPPNVLLAPDGTPRLADFGIALTEESDITEPGEVMGTVSYISPEVLQGSGADHRSDIWSFGVMLYEMLTGRPPFKAGPIGVMVHSILNDPVPDIETLRADVPVDLVDLTYRMLAKEPAERIPGFRLVGAELESIMQGRGSISSQVRMPVVQADSTDANHTVHNLPTPTTPFVGRTTEIAELKQLSESPQVRLITILAQGGMGKTRLALEVARELKNRFTQVTFVPLARIQSTEYLVQTIAEEIGLALSSQDSPKVQLLNYLRNSRMLLVLDNFEHLLERAALVQEILESSSGVTILATSRERLNLQSEVLYNLSTMKVADWSTVDEALSYSSAQLFLLGAKRIRMDFAVRESDVLGLARICCLVDGLPLGILLAAAWVDTFSVDEIADEIEKSLDFLETELRDVPDRQRSIRSILDSTWQRLDPSDQDLFATLSVFRDSFTRHAAQVVAGASFRGLAKLTSKSLLSRDAESGRYHIHELLRQYSQEQLRRSSQASDRAEQAHAAFFADFMNERWSHLRDHRVGTALQDIQDDIANVRAAWRYWLDRRNAEQLRKFIGSLFVSHETWGWIRPAIDLFREARFLLEDSQASELRAVGAYVLATEGWFTSLLGSPDQGIVMARQGIAILRELRADNDLILPLSSFNINAIFLNQLDEVMTTSQEMLRDARAKSWEEGIALIWYASAVMGSGDFGEAQKKAEDSLEVFEQLRSDFGISIAAGFVLGATLMAQGKFSEAEVVYARGLEAAKRIDYRRLVQAAYDSLGTIALLKREVESAHSYFLKSLKITFESGQTREQLGSLRDIAIVHKLSGDFNRAMELLAVILHHPAAGQNSLNRRESLKDEAEALRVEIENMLPPDSNNSAWERGRLLELGKVVAGLLMEDQSDWRETLTIPDLRAV